MEYLLILSGGMLGSAHCVGMCGAFAILLGQAAPSQRRNVARQLLYSSGRILTYALLGALCGFGGWRLGQELRSVLNLQAALAVFAGILLCSEGLFSLGWLRRPFVHACPGAAEFAAMLRAPSWSAVFAAGLVNGLLPCGLVYAYLALSSSEADVLRGAAIMLVFGLGTWPAMILTGVAGSLLRAKARQQLLTVASAALLATGVLTLGRGLAAFATPTSTSPTCPLCTSEEALTPSAPAPSAPPQSD